MVTKGGMDHSISGPFVAYTAREGKGQKNGTEGVSLSLVIISKERDGIFKG